jgi:hypothetical protein
MFPERTPDGKVVVYSRTTGERFVRWPVDARDMMASGAYTTDAPDGAETLESSAPVAPPPDPVPPVTQAVAQSTAQSPAGGPLVVTQSTDAAPAAPVSLPTVRTGSGKRGR